MSKNNADILQKTLAGHFKNNLVNEFLSRNMGMLMQNFASQIERDLSSVDLMPGITLMDYVLTYNEQFIMDRCDYIQKHVVCEEKIPVYQVKDGMPTSRHGQAHYAKSADDILDSWKTNPGKGIQLREDPQGDAYVVSSNGFTTSGNFTMGAGARQYNPYSGQGDNKMATGVVFCDQSDLGTSNHLEQLLGNSYIQGLNKVQPGMEHAYDAVGNPTPASDARLLSRRLFWKNEQGVENGIPVYQQRLHRRNLERDLSESFNGVERDCMISGYDMTDLYARVDHKRAVKAQYEPTCSDMTKLHLQYNSPQFTTQGGITRNTYDDYPLSGAGSQQTPNNMSRERSGDYMKKNYVNKWQNNEGVGYTKCGYGPARQCEGYGCPGVSTVQPPMASHNVGTRTNCTGPNCYW